MTKDEALRLALSTLNEVREETFRLLRNGQTLYAEKKVWDTIYEIKKALETKDEPVAWGMEKDGVILDVICPAEHEREEGKYTIPLYTTPQRTWGGLTKEEINQGLLRSFYVLEKARAWRDGVAWATEQLKEKNT